jgi:hypothetical protein
VFFMVVFLIGTAFAVDLSWVVLSQAELHNVADSAALAGANQLIDNHVPYHLNTQTSAQKAVLLKKAQDDARAAAKLYAKNNGAGDKNSLVLRDEDIEFGFMDENYVYTPLPTYTGYPNTVKVRIRRDSVANEPLGLYFGRVVGRKDIALGVEAAATIYAGVVDSFKVASNGGLGALPVTYDVNHWNNFLVTGQDPDGNIELAADGNPQLQIYPSIKYKGNFGLISLNDDHVGASTVDYWVHNGMRPTDVQTLLDNKLVPLSTHPKDAWDWNGENGFKASNVQDINEYVGKTFVIPLFLPKNPGPANYLPGVGQGSNFYFNIVQFVGVKVMQPDKANREVIVQPAAVIEPEAVFLAGSLKPAQPPSKPEELRTHFRTPKLTK